MSADPIRASKAKEVIKAIKAFSKQRNIDPNKSLLLAGGSMYFRGLKDNINDIDFMHPDLKSFEKQTIGEYELDGGPGGMPEDAYASDNMYGLNIQKPEAILSFYKFLNRPKDQGKIKMLSSIVKQPVSVSGEAIKTAGSRWRAAENLVKLLKRVEQSKGFSLNLETDGYNRNKVLQAVSNHFGLNKSIGQGYTAFTDKLNWKPLPNKIQKGILDTTFNHETPRYIFRGITPGKNIDKPFAFDNAGLKADFLHATPNWGTATDYAKQFGGGRAYQAFKPTKVQPYMADVTAVDFVDKATGTVRNAQDFMWNKHVPGFKKYMSNLDKEFPGVFGEHEKAQMAFKNLVYETPVLSSNKFLGTFLSRTRPEVQTPVAGRQPILDQTKNLLGRTEIASIPKHLNNKFVQMAIENQRKLIN